MAEAKKKAAPKAKTKPDAAVLEDVKAQVMSQIEANQTVDTMPHGPQALFGGDWKGGLKKVVDKVLPALLEAAILSAGGLTPGKIAKIVEIAVRVIPDLIAPEPEGEAA